jgi:hypothetical protein
MMLLVMGGKAATTNPFTLGRANVLSVLNLTYEYPGVQFSSVHSCEFCDQGETPFGSLKVNYQNTEVMA